MFQKSADQPTSDAWIIPRWLVGGGIVLMALCAWTAFLKPARKVASPAPHAQASAEEDAQPPLANASDVIPANEELQWLPDWTQGIAPEGLAVPPTDSEPPVDWLVLDCNLVSTLSDVESQAAGDINALETQTPRSTITIGQHFISGERAEDDFQRMKK